MNNLTEKLMINKNDAVMVCVDYQTSLINAVYNSEELIDKTIRLAKCLNELKVPFLVSQQYTKGLGETFEPIKEAIGQFKHIEKLTFSCAKNVEFMERLEKLEKRTVLIAGIESHICVMQTALELKEMGYDVWLIADCCSSRTAQDKEFAIKRMIHSDVHVTTYEAAVYEMMDGARDSEFKAISKIVK